MALFLGVAAVVGLGGLAVAGFVGGAADVAQTFDGGDADGDAEVGTGSDNGGGIGDELSQLAAGARQAAAAAGIGSKVLDREYADGVHPALQWLLDQWETEGTHVVRIAHSLKDGDGIPAGGLRTDAEAQAATAAQGLSKATNLQQTPHGRGAALDVWPDGFDWHKPFSAQPTMHDLMVTFGEWAKTKQAPTGERFGSGLDFPTPDPDHVQIQPWQGLPYPPPDYSSGLNG